MGWRLLDKDEKDTTLSLLEGSIHNSISLAHVALGQEQDRMKSDTRWVRTAYRHIAQGQFRLAEVGESQSQMEAAIRVRLLIITLENIIIRVSLPLRLRQDISGLACALAWPSSTATKLWAEKWTPLHKWGELHPPGKGKIAGFPGSLGIGRRSHPRER